MSITDALALWGALVSSILAIREFGKDRPRITIMLEYIDFFDLVQIVITNSGPRPITLTGFEIDFLDQRGRSIGIEVPPKQHTFHETMGDYPFPKTIDQGDYVSLTLSEFITGPLVEADFKAKIILHDSEGKKYTKYKTRRYNPKWGTYSKL